MGGLRKRSDLEDRQSRSLMLWLLPVKYGFNQSSDFPLTPNQSSLLRRVEWSMVSKAAKRLNRVNAVTLLSCIDERILLWILRRAVSLE